VKKCLLVFLPPLTGSVVRLYTSRSFFPSVLSLVVDGLGPDAIVIGSLFCSHYDPPQCFLICFLVTLVISCTFSFTSLPFPPFKTPRINLFPVTIVNYSIVLVLFPFIFSKSFPLLLSCPNFDFLSHLHGILWVPISVYLRGKRTCSCFPL